MYLDKATVGNDLAVGIRVPSTVETSQDFLINRVKDYYALGNEVDIKTTIDLCEKIYKYEGTCAQAIDIFVEFAITSLSAEETGDKTLDGILAFYNTQVNRGVTSTIRGMQEIMSKIALDWFVKGNAFPYTSWDNVDVPGVSAPAKLPMRVVCLNPSLINIPEEYQMLGASRLFFQPSFKMSTLLKGDGRSMPGLRDLKKIMKGKESSQYGIPLNPEFASHLKRKSRDYYGWGLPYLTKSFSSLASMRRLRRLDDATTEGLVNLITVYKIGTEERPASAGRLNAFKNLISQPRPSHTLVWGHDVEVEQVGPDGKILAFEKKYIEPRQELLRSLGVPSVLIDPSIARGSDPYVSIIALIEKLGKVRDTLGIWAEDLYHQVAVNNGRPDIYPKVRWGMMNLSNDQVIKNLIMQFYDRGLIDPQTALEESSYDYESVLNRKKKNEKLYLKYFSPPELPFGGKPGDKGRPQKGDLNDKPKDKDKKPAVDQQTQKKPSKPKTTKAPAP